MKEDTSFTVYRAEDGLFYPIYSKPADQHHPPIPDVPENEKILESLKLLYGLHRK